MSLRTFGDATFRSPIAHLLTSQFYIPDLDLSQYIGLGDASGSGVFHFRGKNSANVLHQFHQDVPMKTGDVEETAHGVLVCLKRDEYVMKMMDAENVDKVYEFHENFHDIDGVVLTDLTHGRGQFVVIGDNSRHMLSKVCGIDFSDSAFPNFHAVQTSLAKVKTLIIRADMDQHPTYHLVMDYTVSAYVWEIIFDASQEFNGSFIGSV